MKRLSYTLAFLAVWMSVFYIHDYVETRQKEKAEAENLIRLKAQKASKYYPRCFNLLKEIRKGTQHYDPAEGEGMILWRYTERRYFNASAIRSAYFRCEQWIKGIQRGYAPTEIPTEVQILSAEYD